MPSLYLFGDRCSNFGRLVRPFVTAAGDAPAVAVAHIGQDGWRTYLKEHVVPPLLAAGASRVIPVGPDADGNFHVDEAVALLTDCQAILVSGGSTSVYHRLYVQTRLADVIRRSVANGTPYAGISAGAILAGSTCCVVGNYVETDSNAYTVRVQPGKEKTPVQYGPGLGLIPHAMVEPHCAEWGGLPRLLGGLADGRAMFGIGVDECVCVHLKWPEIVTVTGRGRAYLAASQAGEPATAVRIVEPGDSLAWPPAAAVKPE